MPLYVSVVRTLPFSGAAMVPTWYSTSRATATAVGVGKAWRGALFSEGLPSTSTHSSSVFIPVTRLCWMGTETS
jgi:hypothetical protein